MVGGFHGMLLLSAKYSGSSILMGNQHMKGGSECPLKVRLFRLERW